MCSKKTRPKEGIISHLHLYLGRDPTGAKNQTSPSRPPARLRSRGAPLLLQLNNTPRLQANLQRSPVLNEDSAID